MSVVSLVDFNENARTLTDPDTTAHLLQIAQRPAIKWAFNCCGLPNCTSSGQTDCLGAVTSEGRKEGRNFMGIVSVRLTASAPGSANHRPPQTHSSPCRHGRCWPCRCSASRCSCQCDGTASTLLKTLTTTNSNYYNPSFTPVTWRSVRRSARDTRTRRRTAANCRAAAQTCESGAAVAVCSRDDAVCRAANCWLPVTGRLPYRAQHGRRQPEDNYNSAGRCGAGDGVQAVGRVRPQRRWQRHADQEAAGAVSEWIRAQRVAHDQEAARGAESALSCAGDALLIVLVRARSMASRITLLRSRLWRK